MPDVRAIGAVITSVVGGGDAMQRGEVKALRTFFDAFFACTGAAPVQQCRRAAGTAQVVDQPIPQNGRHHTRYAPFRRWASRWAIGRSYATDDSSVAPNVPRRWPKERTMPQSAGCGSVRLIPWARSGVARGTAKPWRWRLRRHQRY